VCNDLECNAKRAKAAAQLPEGGAQRSPRIFQKDARVALLAEVGMRMRLSHMFGRGGPARVRAGFEHEL
jgi:hypothetical protein